MKLYERFADKGFHTSISTTFGIDFDAYESIVLPRLRGAGCRNNIVMADSRMLTHALAGASVLPKHAGKLYTVNGASAKGVFHPKLFLQFGRRGGRVVVSSANLTASGLAGNLELLGLIECGEDESGESRLIAQAWDYAQKHLASDQQALKGQLDWLMARAPWLSRTQIAQGPERLVDGTLAALLTTGESRGIGQRFAELIDQPVSRLIVVSPYWDEGLGALTSLTNFLSPSEIAILIDAEIMAFPVEASANLAALNLYSRGRFREGRFLHAKALIAQTASADHVLIGSANCTSAALGTASFPGINEEVCLYRALPAGSVLAHLHVEGLLSQDNSIDPSLLEAPPFEDDIPLVDLANQSPGQFEIRVDTLIWYPPAALDPKTCTIELLDQTGGKLEARLTPLASSTANAQRFQLAGLLQEAPAFARLTYADGSRSAIAIVTLIDKLRNVIRESRSRQSENFQQQLDLETDAHLRLLDILDVLEKIEDDDRQQREPRALPHAAAEAEEGTETHYRTLTYEQFLQTRRPRITESTGAHSTLEGSEVSIVRGFLNRILGLQPEVEEESDDEEENLGKKAFNLGDEAENPEQALAEGEEFDGLGQDSKPEGVAEKEAREHAARQKRATREEIIQATRRFQERIKSRREAGQLSNHDVLRLRALLMIVCSASIPIDANKTTKLSSLQVLAAQGDADCWPMLMGRLLFALFGGTAPAIHDLILQNEHDQLPDDVIECWATCYWCLSACLSLPFSGKDAQLAARLEPIASKTYLLTLPSEAELLGDDIKTCMERMDARYAEQLGLEPITIAARHQAIVRGLFA